MPDSATAHRYIYKTMIGYDSSVAAEKAKGKKNQAKIQKARLDHDHDPYDTQFGICRMMVMFRFSDQSVVLGRVQSG